MGGNPGGPQPPPAHTAFSPDGLWWWDGAQWRSTVSPDGLWRWDGRSWVPHRIAARTAGGGGSTALVVTVVAIAGVLVLVGLVTLVVLYTMGNQIANVFSNVAAALGSTPSP